MKNILIAALVAGAAGAALILYLTYDPRPSHANDVADAADDAYRTMNRGIGSVERSTEKVFDDV
jgi:hypothetical protein